MSKARYAQAKYRTAIVKSWRKTPLNTVILNPSRGLFDAAHWSAEIRVGLAKYPRREMFLVLGGAIFMPILLLSPAFYRSKAPFQQPKDISCAVLNRSPTCRTRSQNCLFSPPRATAKGPIAPSKNTLRVRAGQKKSMRVVARQSSNGVPILIILMNLLGEFYQNGSITKPQEQDLSIWILAKAE